jgi:hypothetical protein
VTVYEKVVATSKNYLGPATESFLSRQCKSHLKKQPDELMTSDLEALAMWIEIGAGLVMDKGKATELAGKVRVLS